MATSDEVCFVCGQPLDIGAAMCRGCRCLVCGQAIGDEEPHDYHRPECAVLRGAYATGHCSGHDGYTPPMCDCDGYVHDACCAVCFAEAVIAPLHKYLYDRENR